MKTGRRTSIGVEVLIKCRRPTKIDRSDCDLLQTWNDAASQGPWVNRHRDPSAAQDVQPADDLKIDRLLRHGSGSYGTATTDTGKGLRPLSERRLCSLPFLADSPDSVIR